MAPAVFVLGADGKAAVQNPAGASPDEVVKAARSCPYRAITVVVAATAEQLFPPSRIASPPKS